MINRIVAVIDRIRGRDPKYEADVRAWQKGKEFPYNLYPREQWPAPFYLLVSPEKVLGRCPDCGSYLQLGPTDIFPEFFECFSCGFSGKHPLYCQQKEELQMNFHFTPHLHSDISNGLHNN